MDQEKTLKIKNQLEFYFSDANLVRDEFMRKKISANEGGSK
jgi:hypothetical protein